MQTSIRLATVEDAEEIAAIYAPYVRDTVISFEAIPPSVETMAERMRAVLARNPWLVCVRSGRIAGYAYASPHAAREAYRWSVDSGIYLHSDFHRQGIGRALYTTLFRILPLQGYRIVCAGVTLPNPASVGLHESMGFALVGIYRNIGYKFEHWHDVGWWQRELQPLGNPEPPISLAEVQENEPFRAALAGEINPQ